jgi:hypothetical protein
MRARAAIKQGFTLARRGRSAVWVLFFANLGLAAVAGLPIYRGILRFTGHSLMSQRLVQGLSVNWLTDFAINSPGSLSRYAEMIALFGLLSILVNTLLAGGVLSRLREIEGPFSLAIFFRATARYAWRLIRLMILGLICYWIVFRLVNQSLGDYVGRWTAPWQDERAVFWARLAVTILLLFGLCMVNLVVDYARVKLVMEDGSSAVEAFLSSLGFCLGRFRRAVTVYALPSLAGFALLGVYWLVVPWHWVNAAGAAPGAPYREPLIVALLFIGQQLVMFGRYWFRVATWASEWSYYSGTRPLPPADEPAA